MKILHLSDLHFRNRDISQDLVLSSLLKSLEDIFRIQTKPNIIIITGDIAFSGKSEEYQRARSFIEDIAKICELSPEHVFIIPGNHDVDRTKIKQTHIRWWYNFKDEVELTENLT